MPADPAQNMSGALLSNGPSELGQDLVTLQRKVQIRVNSLRNTLTFKLMIAIYLKQEMGKWINHQALVNYSHTIVLSQRTNH